MDVFECKERVEEFFQDMVFSIFEETSHVPGVVEEAPEELLRDFLKAKIDSDIFDIFGELQEHYGIEAGDIEPMDALMLDALRDALVEEILKEFMATRARNVKIKELAAHVAACIKTQAGDEEDDCDEEWSDGSSVGCSDMPESECTGHCMSCSNRSF